MENQKSPLGSSPDCNHKDIRATITKSVARKSGLIFRLNIWWAGGWLPKMTRSTFTFVFIFWDAIALASSAAAGPAVPRHL